MPASYRPIIRVAFLACIIASATSTRAQSSLDRARAALDEARIIQTELIDRLVELDARHRQAASGADLLASLERLGEMQAAVLSASQGLLARTFGKSLQDLAETERQALGQLAVDQQAVRQRWADWQTRLTHTVGGQEIPEPLQRLQERAADSPTSELMVRAADLVQQNLLSQAAETARSADDELTRLRLAMLAATRTAEQLAEEHLRLLSEFADRERQIRSLLTDEPADPLDWRRLSRHQADLAREVRVLTFPEAAVIPGAHEAIQVAHDAMSEAVRHFQRRKAAEARSAADGAIAALEQAIERATTEAKKGWDLLLPAGPRDQKRPDKLGGMPAMPGESGAGIDMSALAQLTADIALVTQIRRRQVTLYRETSGELRVPAALARLAAGRQRALAALLPQLARRAEAYDPGLVPIFEAARRAMLDATGRLEKDDRQGAVPFQRSAVERLTEAETRMRDFYRRLLEALERFSAPSAEGAPHGAEGEEEKAKMTALLTMLREIVRIGAIMKELDIEIAKAEAWNVGNTAPDGEAVSASARHHREMSRTGFAIVKELSALPGDVVMSLPEAVLEAAQFLEGAADALDMPDFAEVRKRQDIAMEFLQNAWQTMAHSMATLSSGQDADESKKDTEPGDQSDRGAGEAAASVADQVAGDNKPWYWDLPPRMRDAVLQSLAEPLPPKYAPAIERYYDRLSHSQATER
ncbi:MAG: hypothetical protein JXL80_02725 [Planctomycetes bacterium]|nr:hypothetical protein [Planctomycetota bacterium]